MIGDLVVKKIKVQIECENIEELVNKQSNNESTTV